jgi:integrase
MPVAKLTKRAVDAIKPPSRRVIYYDAELKGFGVRVSPSGAKSWCVEYRAGSGGRSAGKRRMVLGSTGALTPDQARSAARKVLAAAALGDDPAAQRNRARKTPTFRQFAESYLTEEAGPKLKPSTLTNYRINLFKHAAAFIGNLRLDKVSHADVAKLHQRIGQAKPVTANRVVECVSSVYRYAATCGLIDRSFNPTAHIKTFREHRRERFLTSKELARLGEAIREAETRGIPWEIDESKPTAKHIAKSDRQTVVGPHAAAALRLLILTGARLGEILNLRWEWVDLERSLLLLPDSKTGRKCIVLNAPAMAVLAALPRLGPYVIAGDNPEKPRRDLKRPWKAISERAGLTGVRIHDLRHTHASIGAGAGLGLPIIGKLLGHTQAATTARYAHLDADPLRSASKIIGDRIAAAMGEALGVDAADGSKRDIPISAETVH